jgi:TM2 domain-containing membrane protein YozV
MHRCIVPLIFSILFSFSAFSQKTKDTGAPGDTITVKRHSPGKAALFSAVVPGLGQIYNHKYWKIPIVYVGYGVMTYFIITNTNNYITYQCAYIEKVNGNTQGNYANLVNRYTEDQLLSAREYYRRNLEISILITAVWYSLTILDAAVDAHLKTFDISKDLSMRIAPAAIPLPDTPRPGAGLRLTLKF